MSVIVGRVSKKDPNKMQYIIHTKDNPLGMPEGDLVIFRSKESAMEIMQDDGMTEEEIKACSFIQINKITCPSCNNTISLNEDDFCQCDCGYSGTVNLYYDDIEFDINGELL